MLKSSMSVLATLLMLASSTGWVSAAPDVTRTAQGPNYPGYRAPTYGNYQPANQYGPQSQYDFGNAAPYGNGSGYMPYRSGSGAGDGPTLQQGNYGVNGSYGLGRLGNSYRSYDNSYDNGFSDNDGFDPANDLQVQVAPSRLPSYGPYQDQAVGNGYGAATDFGFPTQGRYQPSYGTGYGNSNGYGGSNGYGSPQDNLTQPRGSWRSNDYSSYQSGYQPAFAGQYAPGGYRGRHHCRQSGYGWGRPGGY